MMESDPQSYLRDRGSAERISFRGQNISILVHGKETDGAFSVLDYEAPEGTSPPPHRHDFAEVFYVLDGELSVLLGEGAVEVERGSSVYIPGGMFHAPRSDGYLRLLALAVPAGIEEYFQKANEIIEAHDGPVTMEALGDKILPLMKEYTIEPVPPAGPKG